MGMQAMHASEQVSMVIGMDLISRLFYENIICLLDLSSYSPGHVVCTNQRSFFLKLS